MSTLPTAPVEFNVLELGYLTGLQAKSLWDRAKGGDPVARNIYLKLKAAAVSLGVEWRYGDPWDEPVDLDGPPFTAKEPTP